MESLNAIGVFVQAAEARSFVAAGRALGISASAVGKSIARLEERMGVRLFHRSTRSVALTAEAEQFLVRCRRIIGELDEAQAELSESASTPRGRLRISLPIVGKPFLPIFGAFQARYPDVALDVDFNDRMVDIVEEGFDAVIRNGEPRDSRLAARRLGSFRMRVVGAPGYFTKHGTPQQPLDLLHHKCIRFRHPLSGKIQPWLFRRPDAELSPDLPVDMVCNTVEGRVDFAMQGLGVTYVADFVVRAALSQGDLTSVLDDYVVESGVFHLLWPSGRSIAPKLRAFIDFMNENTPLVR